MFVVFYRSLVTWSPPFSWNEAKTCKRAIDCISLYKSDLMISRQTVSAILDSIGSDKSFKDPSC